ncbi:hypothetical protein F5X99DRAFT_404557 [Biscogniauxia marginata]|nr:hypothetical protein F5X99DRAFT_404557 [Biscogniauxia marginata]
MTTSTPSSTARAHGGPSAASPSLESPSIKNTAINENPGVKLSPQQRVIVGSVLDLFEGNPTLRHLSLWSRNATFTDPLTIAQGYDRFAAQWYGLPALFSPIQIQSHAVISSGNPIELNLSNKYVVKAIGKEQIVDSVVRIHVGTDGKIDKVEDKWNGQLPEGSVSEAFRKLNAVTVPTIVKVPKDEEEDKKMKMERDRK